MKNKTLKCLVAFVAGQLVQIVANVLSRLWGFYNPVVFCLCSGFLVFAAIVAGVALSESERQTVERKHTRKETA